MLDLGRTAVDNWLANQKPSIRTFLDAATALEEWGVGDSPDMQAHLIKLGEVLEEFVASDVRNISSLARDEMMNRIRVLLAYIGPKRRLMVLEWAFRVDNDYGTGLGMVLMSMPSANQDVHPVVAGSLAIGPEVASQHNRAFLRYMELQRMIPEVFGPDRAALVMRAITRNLVNKEKQHA